MANELNIYYVDGQDCTISFSKFVSTRHLGHLVLSAGSREQALEQIPDAVSNAKVELAVVGDDKGNGWERPMQDVVDALRIHFPQMPIIGYASIALVRVNRNFPLTSGSDEIATAIASYNK